MAHSNLHQLVRIRRRRGPLPDQIAVFNCLDLCHKTRTSDQIKGSKQPIWCYRGTSLIRTRTLLGPYCTLCLWS